MTSSRNTFGQFETMSNSTYVNSDWAVIAKASLLPPVVFCLCVFLYTMSVILKVYVTTPQIWESARYILFGYMLINDTLYLVVVMFLVVSSYFALTILLPMCYILLTIGSSTFLVTPCILAAMSLERYISVCFPLRHVELCTRSRSHVVIFIIWGATLVPNLVDFISLMRSIQADFFRLFIVCNVHLFDISKGSKLIWVIAPILTLVLVGLIILYTYVHIMIVALKIGSGKSSAFKAARTVMLHAFQLLLCMSALTSPFTEKTQEWQYFNRFLHVLFLTYIPRFIGPLIYGLRDEVIRKGIKRALGFRHR